MASISAKLSAGEPERSLGLLGPLGGRGVRERFGKSCSVGLRQAAFSWLNWKSQDHGDSLQGSFG